MVTPPDNKAAQQSDLKSSAIRGMGWSAIERFGQHGVRFVVQLVLARILLPEQFGLIAMVAVFVAISRGITDAGFSQAIIQRDQVSRFDLDTAFYSNLILGALFSAILWLAAPGIAAFYGEPALIPIVQAICFAVVLASLGMVQEAQMIKELDFRRMLAVNIPATLVSGIASVIMAINGWGVWSLVALLLLQNALQSLMYWMVSPWRPGLNFSWSSFKSLVPYGSRLALAGVLQQVSNNLYVLFIGKFFAPVDVGYYQRADSFKKMGSDNLNAITARVTFPLFARVQNEPERMQRGFLYASGLLALFFFPAMGLLAGVAEPLVEFLIGAKWLPSVPYLQLLCVVGALYPIHAINISIVKALGQSRLVLNLNLIKNLIRFVLLLATFRFGITAIILGQIASSVISLWINAYYTTILLDVSYWRQFNRFIYPALLAVLVFGGSFTVSQLQLTPVIVRLLLSGAAGVIVGLVGFYVVRDYVRDEAGILAQQIPRLTPLHRFLYQNQAKRCP